MKQIANSFKFSVQNKANNTVDIHIDGDIVDASTQAMYEYFGDTTSVSYKSFRDSIPADVATINLFVNSGGGHVGDAMAIHDLLEGLEDKGVTVNREGRGIVASAATYLVMGKNSTLSKNCLFMIHEVAMSVFATMNVTEMENAAASLRVFNDMIVDFYCEKTGLSKTTVGNMMNAETWMTSTEAFAKGFVEKAPVTTATISNRIPAEKWPYQNGGMLNVYNSFFTPNTQSDMESIKELFADFKNEVKAMFNRTGTTEADFVPLLNKLDSVSIAVSNAVTANETTVNNAVQAAVDKLNVAELVGNAISDKLADYATTESVGALATNETVTVLEAKLEALTNDVANKVGNRSTTTLITDEPRPGAKRNRYAGNAPAQAQA